MISITTLTVHHLFLYMFDSGNYFAAAINICVHHCNYKFIIV